MQVLEEFELTIESHHEGPLAGTTEIVEERHPERGVVITNIGKGDE
jgi:hypothetical protein